MSHLIPFGPLQRSALVLGWRMVIPRTVVQMRIDSAQDDAVFRDRFRRIPYTGQTAAGFSPYVSAPADIENAHRSSLSVFSILGLRC